MTVKVIKISGLGSEIKAAIARNSKKDANDFNRRQAEKYLADMIKTGSDEMVDYAKRLLSQSAG